MSLPTIAVICFVLAALGGLVMALRVFGGRDIPWPLALGHGVLGAAGLVVLLFAALSGPTGLVLSGLAVLVLAALGGFYLLSFHIKGNAHPRGVIVIHALIALAGVGLVIAAILTGGAA